MNEKIFKYLAVFLGIIVLWSFCSEPKQESRAYYDVDVQTLTQASEGLDLKAVGELVKKAKDAETLEKLLNSNDEGINNLDLNEDEKVDYISVTEYGNETTKGFSLTVQPAAGDTQEVATIEIEKVGEDKGQMQVQGNEQIYGRDHYYHSHFGLTDFLIMGYLFSPHRFYASPFYPGYYPSYYSPYSTVPHNTYRSNMNRRTTGSSFSRANNSNLKSTVRSPNTGKTAGSIRAPLKNPTASQKSFQSRNPSKQVKSGGFGRTKTGSRASSVRSSSSRRSGGSSRGK